MDSMEAIRVLNFDGSEEKWPEWSKKFKAFMTMKKQWKYLAGDYGAIEGVKISLTTKSEYEILMFNEKPMPFDKEKIMNKYNISDIKIFYFEPLTIQIVIL